MEARQRLDTGPFDRRLGKYDDVTCVAEQTRRAGLEDRATDGLLDNLVVSGGLAALRGKVSGAAGGLPEKEET